MFIESRDHSGDKQNGSAEYYAGLPPVGEVDDPSRVEIGGDEELGNITNAECPLIAEDHQVITGVHQRFLKAESGHWNSAHVEPTRCDPQVLGADCYAEWTSHKNAVQVDFKPVGHGDGFGFSDLPAVSVDRVRVDQTGSLFAQGVYRCHQIIAANEKIDVAGGSHDAIGVIERAERRSLQNPIVNSRILERRRDLEQSHVVPDAIAREVEFKDGHLGPLVSGGRDLSIGHCRDEQSLQSMAPDGRLQSAPIVIVEGSGLLVALSQSGSQQRQGKNI
jgi:hypothetical protein